MNIFARLEAKAQSTPQWDDADADADLAILAKVQRGDPGPIQFTPTCDDCGNVMCIGCGGN